jgi:hypothetical protein
MFDLPEKHFESRNVQGCQPSDLWQDYNAAGCFHGRTRRYVYCVDSENTWCAVVLTSNTSFPEKIELEGNAELAPSSFAGTSDKVGAGSQRKIRGSKRTVQNDITSHFKSKMTSTEDPRMCQPGPTKKRTLSSKRVPGSASQALWNSGSGARAAKPSVTPSPKPAILTQGQTPPAGVARANRVSSKSPIAAVARNASSQGVWTHAVGDTGRRETTSEIISKRPLVPQRADQTPAPLSHGPSWKQAKREQQRSQQRAFTQKRDNPFSLYKHDPNDAESYLDGLSSRNTELSPQSSVIPSEGLQALARAYQVPRQARGGIPFHQQRPAAGQRGRRQVPEGRLSERDLLAQKAAEQNEYAIMPSMQALRATMSPFATQDLYSDRSPAFDRPGRVNQLYGSQMTQSHTAMMPMHQGVPRYADEWAGGVDDRSYPVAAPPGRDYEGPSAFYDGASNYQHSSESTQQQGAFQQRYYPRGGASASESFHPNERAPHPHPQQHQHQQPRVNQTEYPDFEEATMGYQGPEDTWHTTSKEAFTGMNRGEVYGTEQCPPEFNKVSHGPSSFEDVYGMDQKDLEATFF